MSLTLRVPTLVMHSDEVPDNIRHYAQKQWQRPSVQAWLALPEKMRG